MQKINAMHTHFFSEIGKINFSKPNLFTEVVSTIKVYEN